jgi:transcriptional regulator with XRE-family HTH domain
MHMPVRALIHNPQALRKARLRAGYNLTQAADLAGVTKQHLSQLEHGHYSFTNRPSLLVQLAALYGAPIEDLEATS